MSALREALERASRAAHNAELLATRARQDLQAERTRYKHVYAEWQKLTQDLEQALEENKRLRRSIGDMNQDRETLSERIRQLTIGSAPKAAEEGLRVVQNPGLPPVVQEPEISEEAVVEFPDTLKHDKSTAMIGQGFRLVMGQTPSGRASV